MPQNARIFLVEDESLLRAGFKSWLEAAEHQVVLEATYLSEALSKVEVLGAHQVNVAVLDGNLTKDDNSGENGGTIARAIRDRFPDVRILCLSLGNYDWADRVLAKGNVFSGNGGNPLGDAVTAL